MTWCIWGHYHKEIWRYQSVKQDWRLDFLMTLRSHRSQWIKRPFSLTHPGTVMHIHVNEINHCWFWYCRSFDTKPMQANDLVSPQGTNAIKMLIPDNKNFLLGNISGISKSMPYRTVASHPLCHYYPYPEPVVIQWQSSGNPVCLEFRPQCTLECHWIKNCFSSGIPVWDSFK